MKNRNGIIQISVVNSPQIYVEFKEISPTVQYTNFKLDPFGFGQGPNLRALGTYPELLGNRSNPLWRTSEQSVWDGLIYLNCKTYN